MRIPTIALIPLVLLACGGPAETTVEMTRTLPTPEVLEHHCRRGANGAIQPLLLFLPAEDCFQFL